MFLSRGHPSIDIDYYVVDVGSGATVTGQTLGLLAGGATSLLASVPAAFMSLGGAATGAVERAAPFVGQAASAVGGAARSVGRGISGAVSSAGRWLGGLFS
jgi:hypothetical protein